MPTPLTHPVPGPARPGLVVRALAALDGLRRRAAEAEIARLIERNGGRLTDELERTIERRFL